MVRPVPKGISSTVATVKKSGTALTLPISRTAEGIGTFQRPVCGLISTKAYGIEKLRD